MNTQKNNLSLYHQYSQKEIKKLVDPQYIGLAHHYSAAKKIRLQTEQTRNYYGHQVSALTKVKERLEKNLKKKSKELEYVKKVRSRYISQMLQKSKINENKLIEQQRLRHKTIQQRINSQYRNKLSKNRVEAQKRNAKQQMINILENERLMRKQNSQRQFFINNSRVKAIEDQKKRINEKCIKFYRKRNKASMQNYLTLIKKERISQQNAIQHTQQLQRKLIELKIKIETKQKIMTELNQSIDSLRSSKLSRKQSSQKSFKLTPLQILTTDSRRSENKFQNFK